MFLNTIDTFITQLTAFVWSWPLIIFVVASGLIMTVAFNGIQFRYFGRAWKYVFSPEKGLAGATEAYITPLQAFINTLSASIGNGSTAGMATAIYSGGPGAAFWIFVLGFFNMAIRFAEVYASTTFVDQSATGAMRGGPMAYLKRVPGGTILPYIYAFFCLMLTFISGNAMQCNSMTLGIQRMTNANSYIIAGVLFAFLLYIMLGGAHRIMKVSEQIIPVKVGLFFMATLIALIYHYQSLIPAIKLIIESAFTSKALGGALVGYAVQDAIRFGISITLNATEAGIGTAAILFGATGSKNPVRSGIMSMASIFVSNYMVCFALTLIIVASGVWNSGLDSTPLTSAAYETVFGVFGGWIVTFLSGVFGMGVLVAYAYIGRECWLFLTNGRWLWLYTALYCLMALFGSLGKVTLIWNMIGLINAGLITVNVYGLLYLLPHIRKGIQAFMNSDKAH